MVSNGNNNTKRKLVIYASEELIRDFKVVKADIEYEQRKELSNENILRILINTFREVQLRKSCILS